MTKQIKILVIDDDPYLNKIYINKLAQEGFLVLTAMDGEAGLQKIQEHKPSLVVMDVVLPRKSGFDVLESVKRDVELKNIPVMVVTNLSTTRDVQRAMKLGASDYLIKSRFTIDDILNRIQQQIRDHRVKEVYVDENEIVQAQSRPLYEGTRMKMSAVRAGIVKNLCDRCGAQLVPGARFCPNCGTKV